MNVDPLASMRCWAIEIELGGRTYEVPALPAADWWPVLSAMDPHQILDMIPSTLGDPDDLDAQLLDGRLAESELTPALIEAIEEVTGRSLHVVLVLTVVANSEWPAVGGALAREGFRWDRAPIGAALDAVYAIILDCLPEKDAREKFLKLLENEQLTTGKRKPVDRAKVMSEFEAMAGPRPAPTPVRSTAGPSGSEPPKTRSPRQPPRQGGRSSGPRKPPAPPVGSDPPASS